MLCSLLYAFSAFGIIKARGTQQWKCIRLQSCQAGVKKSISFVDYQYTQGKGDEREPVF